MQCVVDKSETFVPLFLRYETHAGYSRASLAPSRGQSAPSRPLLPVHPTFVPVSLFLVNSRHTISGHRKDHRSRNTCLRGLQLVFHVRTITRSQRPASRFRFRLSVFARRPSPSSAHRQRETETTSLLFFPRFRRSLFDFSNAYDGYVRTGLL